MYVCMYLYISLTLLNFDINSIDFKPAIKCFSSLDYLQFGNILTIEDSIIIVIVIDTPGLQWVGSTWIEEKSKLTHAPLKQKTV